MKKRKVHTFACLFLLLFLVGCGNDEVYDLKNGVIRVTLGNVVQEKEFDANGNMIRYLDRNGQQTIYEYDEEGLLLKKQESLGSRISVYSFEYDSYGNMAANYHYIGDFEDSSELSLSSMYTYKYNESGNLAEECYYDSDGKLRSKHQYNNDGKLLTSYYYNDEGYDLKKYKYDSKGNEVYREVTFSYKDGNRIENSCIYEYEPGSDNIKKKYKIIYVWEVAEIKLSEEYEYDSAGNVLKKIKYDAYEKCEEITYYAGGKAVVSARCIDGDPSKQYVTEQRFYDEYGNFIKVLYYTGEDNDAFKIGYEEYEYDKNGNILKEVHYDEDGQFRSEVDREYDENNLIVKEVVYNKDRVVTSNLKGKTKWIPKKR